MFHNPAALAAAGAAPCLGCPTCFGAAGAAFHAPLCLPSFDFDFDYDLRLLWLPPGAVGVKHMAPAEPHSGPLAFLYKAEDYMRESASTLMFTAYLFALRE